MPGPGIHRREKLVAAFKTGLVNAPAIREAARRILRLIARTGAFEDPDIPAERAENRPETRTLIRRAGADAMVLLKNEGALPLVLRKGAKIAVLGPNARFARAMGGGSAQLNAHYLVAPYDALHAAVQGDVALSYELGADNRRLAAELKGTIVAEFYDGTDFAGPVKRTTESSEGVYMFVGAEGPGVATSNFSARLHTRQTPEVSGDHRFSLVSTGPSRLYVDGDLVVDGWDFAYGEEYFATASNENSGVRCLEAGRTYEIVVEWRSPDHRQGLDLTVLRMGITSIVGQDAIERAVALAKDADAALLFVGLNGEWDGEGMDRPNLDLPGLQNELIHRVAEANPNTIVILQSGCPILMPWLNEVAAVLQAWYPGQEVGHSIADVLLGKAEPGGRLPQTFPCRLEDDPTRINYPGEAGHVRYGEGIYVGYRYAEKLKIAPLFPFGFGLSYTRFAAGPLQLDRTELVPGATLTASIDVTNVGDRPGSTVLQLYVADTQASVSRPVKELKGFAKVFLAPRETQTITLTLDMRALAFFDVLRKAWVAEADAFTLLAGFSSAKILAKATFVLRETWVDNSSPASHGAR
jgi:beta-glucosidase